MSLLASFMNLAGPDLIVILLIILVLFGAKKLPELARGMGQAVKEFQKAKDEFSDELHKAGKSEAELRAQIKEMVVKNLMLQVTPEQIGDDLPLFGPDGLGLDSIDALELVVSMEKTFGVGVPSSDVAGKALRTVNTIHDYILEKRAAAA